MVYTLVFVFATELFRTDLTFDNLENCINFMTEKNKGTAWQYNFRNDSKGRWVLSNNGQTPWACLPIKKQKTQKALDSFKKFIE